MKKSIALALCLLSSSAFAFINEVECTVVQGSRGVLLEIEQPFPANSVFKQALMTVIENGAEKEFNYSVVSRRSGGMNRLQYTGGGIRLEVDLWPDTTPRWGRNYRSTLSSSDLGNGSISNVDCQFPNAF